MLSLLWGFKLLQEKSTKAKLMLSQVQTGVLACSRQLSSSSSQAAEVEAPRRMEGRR